MLWKKPMTSERSELQIDEMASISKTRIVGKFKTGNCFLLFFEQALFY